MSITKKRAKQFVNLDMLGQDGPNGLGHDGPLTQSIISGSSQSTNNSERSIYYFLRREAVQLHIL